MKQWHLYSAIELRDAFLRGDVSAVDIASHFLDRIERYNPSLGSFLSVFQMRVMLKAETLDRKRSTNKPLGKLAAVPVALKDNMHLQGEFTTCASRFLETYRAPFTATAVRLLEEQDALFLGKTNLDEFAMGSGNENSAFFPASNPWDLSCVPGGSSGGSSAAIGARLALLATGTDTGGSIRQPASFCGIVGFKPSYGRVSRYGLVGFGSSLDHIGPMGVTVADMGLAMGVLGRHCPYDSTSLDLPAESHVDHLTASLEGIRFGVPWHFLQSLKPELRANFSESLRILKELGAEVVEINLDICKYAIAVYYIIATAEASTNLARFDGIRYGHRSPSAQTLDDIYEYSRSEGFGKEIKKRIMLGTYVLSVGYQDAFYKKAQKTRSLVIEAFNGAFAEVDAIALPVAPTPAFSKGSIHDPLEMYLQDIFTIPASLAGLPAISVPSGFSKEHKPFGLQIIGPQMHDAAVIQYGHAFEQATRYSRKLPPDYLA